MKMGQRSKIIALLVTLVTLIGIGDMSAATAESTAINCTTSFNAYSNALSAYNTNAKPSGSDFKQLSDLFKAAQQERSECLKEINQSFKDQLQQIRDKYAAQLSSANKKVAATLRTQLASEISAATLNRDEIIKNLPALPRLPAKAKKK